MDLALPIAEVRPIVENAVREDLGWGDITTDNMIPRELNIEATLLSKAEGVLAGIDVFALVFKTVDPTVEIEVLMPDGSALKRGDVVARINGPAVSVLRGERVALNFIQRLSGIATLTRHCMQAAEGTKARIVETRKTVPGLRILEKYAVRVGGGHNHRYNLSDGVLVKDNHLASMARLGYGPSQAIALLKSRLPHTVRVEVEVDHLDQIEEVLAAGVEIILLDNFTVEQIRQAVELIAGRAVIEVSGGITLETIPAIAATGVDILSVGALTHSVRALDLSLDM